jgi:hypothetical protein
MRVRSLVALAATLLIGLGVARTASADPKSDVAKELKQAMSSYDSMDYDAAKRTLKHAIETAKRSHLDNDPIAAQAYLDLGIVAFANSDQSGAKEAFAAAAKINPSIQIDPAYRSDDMANLLDSVRGGAASSGGDVASGGDAGVDCSSVKGLQHDLIDSAPAGRAERVEALLSPEVKAVKVSVMYRSEGKTQFSEVQMQKQGQCTYVAQIPASAMRGSMVQYYVAAYGGNGRPVAEKGSEGSPNLMEVTGTAPAGVAGDDSDDPLGGGAKSTDSSSGGASSGGEVSSSSKPVTPKHTKLMIAISGGTGFGYVSGGTEGGNAVKNCCIGNSLAVVMPEIAYFVNPRTSVGVVVRLGFPLGANYPGHATMAPGGLLRVRYALKPDGEGVHVMGQIGAGILRDTIKLDNGMAGMDTDIVAQGPLLLGGGVGFTKHVAPSVAFLVDASVLAAIDVVGNDMKGNSTLTGFALNSGVAADVSIGLALGF